MSDYVDSLAAAARAVTFHSPTTYSWFGILSPRLDSDVRRALPLDIQRNYLLHNLQLQFYSDYYCLGIASSANRLMIEPRPAGIATFVNELSAANNGRGSRQSGWEVRAVEEDIVVAVKGDLELRVRHEDCTTTGSHKPPVPGQQTNLRFPKELFGIDPGHYTALGDHEILLNTSHDIVRFYWNVSPQGAPSLVHLVTSALNKAALPFRLKLLNDPGQYERCDAAVLYTRKEDYANIALALEQIYSGLSQDLKPGTPALTKRLAVGLGFAEDPGGEESFGQHRCRLIAEGILRAHEVGREDVDARLEYISSRFIEEGNNLEHPYLNLGSCDEYRFVPHLPPQVRPANLSVEPERLSPGDSHIETATRIGRYLTTQAVWYKGQCNWMGSTLEEDRSGDYLRWIQRALGPDLYSGTAGIALFLAELYSANHEMEVRATAIGAIRRALIHSEDIPPGTRLGLHCGWPGLALAAARVGALVSEAEFIEAAHQLMRRCADEAALEQEFDLLAGKAGGIVAALALREALQDDSLTDLAQRLADELCRDADKSEKGWSWRSVGFQNRRNLTGLSHGAAGVGYALLELYAATGDNDYRRWADLAFGYERSCFDTHESNWPDFREEPGDVRKGKRPPRFAIAWCHGAPGIAMTRLRAFQITSDPTCKAEATAALRTTRRALEAARLGSGVGNYSLCHGIAGNAEALIYGQQALGHELPEETDPSEVLQLAWRAIERFATHPPAWPPGTSGSENPGLMIGLAGIGYFCLRLHDPKIPSILLPQREQITAGTS